jgi:hypothetical protein
MCIICAFRVSGQGYLFASCVSSLPMPLDLADRSLGVMERARLDEYVFPRDVRSARGLLESSEKTVHGRDVQHSRPVGV